MRYYFITNITISVISIMYLPANSIFIIASLIIQSGVDAPAVTPILLKLLSFINSSGIPY